MKLLANGCSLTHGQELVTDGYDPANTEFCYAKILADQFSMSYENIALPGISNKHIVESTFPNSYPFSRISIITSFSKILLSIPLY